MNILTPDCVFGTAPNYSCSLGPQESLGVHENAEEVIQDEDLTFYCESKIETKLPGKVELISARVF